MTYDQLTGLDKIYPAPVVMKLPFEMIAELIKNRLPVTFEQIISETRQVGVVRARFIFIFLARRYSDAHLSEIGRYVARDHSSCIYAINGVKDMVESKNTEYCALLKKTEQIILNYIYNLAT